MAPFLYLKRFIMLNCKIYRDISFDDSNGCMMRDVNAGVYDGLYVFNIDDVKGLIFDDDSRPDTSLFVDTIITSQPYYRIDATSIEFEEEYVDHHYSQTLKANIATSREEVEEILQAAVHGSYIVAFRMVGSSDYKLIGWKEGLSLDDSLSISTDGSMFTLTFEGTTTFPMMEADKSNFDLANKVFDPMYEALFSTNTVVCNDGWATAMYVVKVNAAGLPLDANNKLTQFSGNRQDAYKLVGAPDGNYNIIGTYTSSDILVEGAPIRKMDPSLCEITGDIYLSKNTITLNSSHDTDSFNVISSHGWELVSYPAYVELSRRYGDSGTTEVLIHGLGTCGTETLTFRNVVTNTTANLTVYNDRISIGSSYTYPWATQSFTLSPVTCGAYSVTSTEGNVTINPDGTFTVRDIAISNEEKNLVLTLTSGSETRTVNVTIKGRNTNPGVLLLREWCETDG